MASRWLGRWPAFKLECPGSTSSSGLPDLSGNMHDRTQARAPNGGAASASNGPTELDDLRISAAGKGGIESLARRLRNPSRPRQVRVEGGRPPDALPRLRHPVPGGQPLQVLR